MRSFDVPLALGFLFLLSAQMTDALPLQNTVSTSEDMDVLKLLLQRLEESIPASSRDQRLSRDEEDKEEVSVEETPIQPQSKTDMREYLSARDLKTVRMDSKRYSGCFGRRLDRIGSMSSLGCNTASRTSPKRK
ncbi:natriuretic peptides B [Misgurnus anguillicaudatus]|uniref:natriuretic peptides B n=1 Tax=Misgurnus anguillicaudatus TaxID=75329 RepID=UPI002434A3C1|nr:natriuretic peptides B [Misgurnus anguillicaudatus]